jgi:coatomer subunit beta'
VDFHPTEPWTLSALYSGNIFIWDYNTQTLVKQLEVCNLPVRCAKFVTRKQWIITASDDMHVRVFNYNTLEKVHEIEAHTDYIRYLSVHPSMPYVLSSSDDMSIKLWDWDKNWSNSSVFEGHAHYVMMTQWNPKDGTIFASCSLDRSLKVWGITGNNTNAHFTLNGHQKGVNCVEYAPTGEKPYLISGSDDRTVKIWDYQTKQCIQTLDSHTNNVSAALFHPVLPIILTGSEDGTVKVWHAATYRLESTLNYLLERVWSIAVMKGSNSAAFGYDEGTVVIKLGSEEPVASMHSGKIIWAKGNDIQTTNLKRIGEGEETADGERMALSVQDMGAAEIFPQYIKHHPNGRLFAVCGDGEYVIYTAQALRNKSFGSAQEFAWGSGGDYATRDASGKITVYKDFKENFSFKPPFNAEEIFGGHLIGVKGSDFVCFYDWNEYLLVRRIDVTPKDIIWSEDSESGSHVVLVCADSFYILKHDKHIVTAALAGNAQPDEDGFEAAFELVSEVTDKVISGTWVSDCFVYVTSSHRLLCLVAGSTETIAHLDRVQYLLGYLPEQSKLFLVDKELNVVPYTLHLALVEYQSAIMRKDFDESSKQFAKLPESLHNRVARFLENQGYALEALEISKDDDHCFELATQLGKLEQAAGYIRKICAQGNPAMPPRGKWKSLGDVALEQGNFELARSCFNEAKDLGALFLVHTACGDAEQLKATAEMAKATGVTNIAVLCFILLGEVEEALQVLITANRLPEAAFFARCYCPSQLEMVVKLWKTDLSSVNTAVAESLADPVTYPTLFPDFDLTVAAENAFKLKRKKGYPASQYAEQKAFQDEINVMEKIKELQPAAFQAMLLGGSSPAPVAAAPPPVAKPPIEPEPVVQAAPVVQQEAVNETPLAAPMDYEQAAPETVVEETSVPAPEFTATAPEEVEPSPEVVATEPSGGQADLLGDLLS